MFIREAGTFGIEPSDIDRLLVPVCSDLDDGIDSRLSLQRACIGPEKSGTVPSGILLGSDFKDLDDGIESRLSLHPVPCMNIDDSDDRL